MELATWNMRDINVNRYYRHLSISTPKIFFMTLCGSMEAGLKVANLYEGNHNKLLGSECVHCCSEKLEVRCHSWAGSECKHGMHFGKADMSFLRL